MKLDVSEEIRAFLRRLAPEPRKKVARALDGIEDGTARLEPLHEPLDRYYKLRSGRFRILCAVEDNTVFALYAAERSIVYEVATAAFLETILRRQRV